MLLLIVAMLKPAYNSEASSGHLASASVSAVQARATFPPTAMT